MRLATATLFLVAASASAAVAPRERINFDFGWRHILEDTPSKPAGTCPQNGTVGKNYGTGGDRHKNVASPLACCDLCAAQPTCGCWDWNTETNECWTKSECDSEEDNAHRVSARVRATPTPAPSTDTPPQARPAFNDSAWEAIQLPHDMLIAQPFDRTANEKQAFLPRGTGWYRKTFALPAEWKGSGSSLWLYVEGSFHVSTVWVNGHQIMIHKAGYTSFSIHLDAVPGLMFGPGTSQHNVVAIHVDASSGTGWWYEGGGLNRHVWLVRANHVHMAQDTVWVHTPHVGNDTVEFVGAATVAGAVSSSSSSSTLRMTILDASGQAIANGTSSSASLVVEDQMLTVSVHVDASKVGLWSVQRPTLYTAQIELLQGQDVVDTVNITTGVRTLDFDAKIGLLVNDEHVKLRGFCDHSNFGGVGAAVPDRVNLFRAQQVRGVGGNSWRMAHNPPTLARLDVMDALGMLAIDENRDYGGGHGQGGDTSETVAEELQDMADLIKRDRSHPSVMIWSFCNEVGCNNESSAAAFRAISKAWDPTRAVTQNHLGMGGSTASLDVQGFSHKSTQAFESFHALHPDKPEMATECCSCMSQRAIDEDTCPEPKDGGCDAGSGNACRKGEEDCPVFYNNNIGKCTADQVKESDSLDYVTGTFVWSGFDYLGEARGWPQNTKCRGTIADVAGFEKETASWLRSWWLANISKADAGYPVLSWQPPFTTQDEAWTVSVLEAWSAPPAGMSSRTIHVYTNAPEAKLLVNGKAVGSTAVDFFSMASFDDVAFEPGNLTAVALDATGAVVASHTVLTAGARPSQLVLSLDAPSASTGTGTALVLDGQDTAMVRATVLDGNGVPITGLGTALNISFRVVSGPGAVWATHNGDPANTSPSLAPWTPSYGGLARAFVRTTEDSATTPAHRRRLREIDVDAASGPRVVDPDGTAGNDVGKTEEEGIVLEAEAVGSGVPAARITIPVSQDVNDLPVAVAARLGARAAAGI